MDFPDFLQFIIFGPKPYSRGSGARKQPQQRLSNVGLLPIGWGSAVLDRLAASQMRRIPGQATPTHTWGGRPPPPLIRTCATCAMSTPGEWDAWTGEVAMPEGVAQTAQNAQNA